MGQLGEDNQLKPDGSNMPPVLICSLLLTRFHAKIIRWGHDSQDFVELGFFESDGEEDDEYDEEEAAFIGQ